MVLTIPCNLISNRYSPIQDLVKSTTYEVSFDKLQDKLSSQKKLMANLFKQITVILVITVNYVILRSM